MSHFQAQQQHGTCLELLQHQEQPALTKIKSSLVRKLTLELHKEDNKIENSKLGIRNQMFVLYT